MNHLRLPLLLAILVAPADAATAVLTVDAATHIRAGALADTPQNGDTDQEDLVGEAAGTMRTLYRFNLAPIVSDVNALGGGNFANLQVTSVTLQVFERRGTAVGFNQAGTYELRSYAFAFNEATATWNDPAPGDSTDGGTLGVALSTFTLDSGTWNTASDNDSATFGSTSDFINFIAASAAGGGSANFILNKSTALATSFISLTSNSSSNPARHPTLTVQYTVVPEPAAALLFPLAGALVLGRRRRD